MMIWRLCYFDKLVCNPACNVPWYVFFLFVLVLWKRLQSPQCSFSLNVFDVPASDVLKFNFIQSDLIKNC